MKRRDFLKSIAASGLVMNTPWISSSAHADSITGRYLVVVNASGGWDPTSLCDPKGLNEAYPDLSTSFNGSTNSVAVNPAKKLGQIQWSQVPDTVSSSESTLLKVESQIDGFFNEHGNRMVVVNGIDTGTNNHDTGSRHVWSGLLDAGYPAMSAFFAATTAPTLPMAFLSNGGYDYTASAVARARASSSDFIAEIADANLMRSGYPYLYQDETMDVYSMVKQAQERRLSRLRDQEQLERRRTQLNQLFGVRSNESDLSQLTVYIDELNNNVAMDEHWNENTATSLKKQARVVAAALKANLAVSANLNTSGFDSHNNHDAQSYPLMGDLLEGVHYLVMALEYLGIREQTTIVIGSDFGRTPYYNLNGGKDHWPITSMIVLQGDDKTTGGKVFGASTSDFNSTKVNVSSGLADSSGLVLEPAHVNQELRKLLGVADHPLAELFPLPESNFNIFV